MCVNRQMLMDPMGGIVMTNDGNAILREVTVVHRSDLTSCNVALGFGLFVYAERQNNQN